MPDQIKNIEYDVAIIGAGISGLTAAAIAGRFGLKCCILEKEPNAGGYLAGFNRKDFHFDSAIHWLNQCNKNEMVGRIFNLIGSDSPKIKTMENIHRFKGETYNYLLTNNPDKLKETLIKDFPNEKNGIKKFFKAAKKIGAGSLKYANLFRTDESMSGFEKIFFKLKLFKFILPLIKYVFYSGEKGVTKGLNKFFKNKNLHKLYSSEKDLLSCLFPIAWAYNNGYQFPEKGGARVFIQWLSHVNKQLNNDLILNAKVTKLNIVNESCENIIFKQNGKEHTIKSKYVISTNDVETLYTKMLPESTISQKFIKKLNDAVLYSSAFTVSIALDCPAEDLGFNQELISITKEGIKRDDHDCGDPLISDISVIAPSARDKSLTPEGKGMLSFLIPAYIDYKDYWQTEKDEAGNFIRGEKYKKLKTEVAEILIKRVEKELSVNIKKHILFYDVSTPITYFRYTGNKNGTMMGARPGKKNMQAGIAHHQTPIKNLILSGHWSDLGGGVPISVKAAINAVLLVLKKDKKKSFKLLSNYIDGKIDVNKLNKSSLVKDYDNSWKNLS
ncbi:MAG: NAD(P)-binding protein [Bacteroidales bacterium]|jgi:phytoene dehydrogenase-like protein|nr:NAD(P)-binding protein [Bacteroidales bacterium]